LPSESGHLIGDSPGAVLGYLLGKGERHGKRREEKRREDYSGE
jgi:hypothetical protein